MRQKLFNLYNRLKKSFVDEVTDIVRHKGGEVTFDPIIRINKFQEDGILFYEIACLQYDEKEKTLYVHLQETVIDDVATERHDYWSPLRDELFDDILTIAERL